MASSWLQHSFKISYNIPTIGKKAPHQGSRQVLLSLKRHLQPPLRSSASLGQLWLGNGLEWEKVLKEFFQLFVVPLLLLSAGVGFLLLVFDDENVLLLKYNQFRKNQARDEQVEDKQDQSMKGCSHNELDKERYQQ